MLPPEVIAQIGGFLDAPSRAACVLAAKPLRSVHELNTHHVLLFKEDGNEKMMHIDRVVAYVLELMPRLKTLTLTFRNYACHDVDACALFRAQMRALNARRVSVELKFEGLIQAPFVRRAVWDIANVNVCISLPPETLIADALAILDVCDYTNELFLSGTDLFHALPSSTLHRVRNVGINIRPPSQSLLNMSHVDPTRTSVNVTGFIGPCTMMQAHKLARVNYTSPADAEQRLISSLLAPPPVGELCHIRELWICDITPRSLPGWCAVAGVLPTGARVVLRVNSPTALPFIERLEAVRASVTLYVGDDDNHRAARMVQLITNKQYPIWAKKNYTLRSAISRLETISGVFDGMSENQQRAWHMAKYMTR